MASLTDQQLKNQVFCPSSVDVAESLTTTSLLHQLAFVNACHEESGRIVFPHNHYPTPVNCAEGLCWSSVRSENVISHVWGTCWGIECRGLSFRPGQLLQHEFPCHRSWLQLDWHRQLSQNVEEERDADKENEGLIKGTTNTTHTTSSDLSPDLPFAFSATGPKSSDLGSDA